MEYGTEAQKDHWLPRLADGREFPCFGLTSPEAGSDAASMTDNGVVCRGQHEGREVLGIRLLIWIAAPVSLFIGTVGAVSVIKAVYVAGREVRCAFVGGNSQVPLGSVSLTENLMMIAMGGWMLVKSHVLCG